MAAEYAKAEEIAGQIRREVSLYLGKVENTLRDIQDDPLLSDPDVSDGAKNRELQRIADKQSTLHRLRREKNPLGAAGEEAISVQFFGPEDRTSSFITWRVPIPESKEVIFAETPLPEVWRILDGVEIGGGGGAILIDETNKILSHRNKTRLRTYIATESLGQRNAEYQSPDGDIFYTVVHPLGKKQFPYRVVLTFPKRPIDTLVLEALLIQMFIGSLTTALAWILGIISSRHLTSGLSKASQMAEVVAGGNLEARLPNEGPKEVKQLADSFNSMVRELEVHHNHLEEMVDERTAELEEATSLHQELAAELQAAYDAGKEGLWLVHRSGVTASENAAFRNLFGIAPKKGEPAKKFFSKIAGQFEDPGAVKEWLESSLKNPDATDRIRWNRAGENGIVGGYSSPVSGGNDSSEPFAVLFSFSDFTEETRIQKELEEARRFESVGHLVGSVAHEFNNLLAAVMGNIEIAGETETPEPEKLHGSLTEAKKSASKAAELVQGLLSFSQQNLLQRKPCNPGEVLNQTLKHFYEKHGTEALQGVRWNIKIPRGLPTIEADQSKLFQAIEQFLENSLEAINGNGIIAVQAMTTRDKDKNPLVEIRVTDNGKGILPEIRDRIFEPFFSTRRDRKGLGLAMCHGVIRQHEGTLLCESEPGKGTRMTIQLPIASIPSTGFNIPDQSSKPDSETPAASTRTEESSQEKSTVLVVDDDRLVRTVTQKILEKGGYEVLCAEGGKKALAIYREKCNDISLIVLDLRMPEMMGTEVMEHLFEEYGKDVPVVVCSGYLRDYQTEAEGGPRLEPLAFLEKPVGAAQMLETVGTALAR